MENSVFARADVMPRRLYKAPSRGTTLRPGDKITDCDKSSLVLARLSDFLEYCRELEWTNKIARKFDVGLGYAVDVGA